MGWFAFNILCAWLLADFLTGLVHWAQDKLLTEPTRFKFLNAIKTDNDLHHTRPGLILRYSWWGNISTSVPYAIPLAILLFFIGAPMVIYLAVFFGAFANLIHRFSHLPKNKLNGFLRFMQFTGLFISIDHHKTHHYDGDGIIKKEDTTIRYCPMTNLVNPLLDRVRFFHHLESIYKKISRQITKP